MNTQPLTIDSIRDRVPSAFATHAHSSRSERYTYIPTVDVIEGMMASGFQVTQAIESRYRDASKAGYTKHMLRFRPQGTVAIVGDTFLEVALVNSHDGSSAYKLFAAIFRFTCANGMCVSDGTLASIKVRHSGNVVPDVLEGAGKIIEAAPRITQQIEGWQRLQLTTGEQSAFAEAAHTLRFADADGKVETPITAAQLLTPRRREDMQPDLWHTMNRVQENVTKGGQSAYGRDSQGRRRMTTTRTIKGIDQDVRLNRSLWQLAEKMAELKATPMTQ